MFSRYTSSWELLKASASVLRSDKQLLVFPLVSAVASLFVTATFFIPAAMYAYAHHMFTKAAFDAPPQTQEVGSQLHSVMGYLFMFMFYLAQYLVIFFANTALVGAALIRLRGGKPTVRDGFNLAMTHLAAIAVYALISATVGRGGAGIIRAHGVHWPHGDGLLRNGVEHRHVLGRTRADHGDMSARSEGVKRSAALLKRTWGEQIIGGAGLNAAFRTDHAACGAAVRSPVYRGGFDAITASGDHARRGVHSGGHDAGADPIGPQWHLHGGSVPVRLRGLHWRHVRPRNDPPRLPPQEVTLILSHHHKAGRQLQVARPAVFCVCVAPATISYRDCRWTRCGWDRPDILGTTSYWDRQRSSSSIEFGYTANFAWPSAKTALKGSSGTDLRERSG